jgi:hypothetical protein
MENVTQVLPAGFPASRLLCLLLCGMAAAPIGCSSSSGSSTPAGTVSVTAPVTSLAADGTTAALTVTVLDASGLPGTGTVHVFALQGTINDKTSADVALAAGVAQANYACDVSKIAACSATSALVAATWNGVTSSLPLTLTHGQGASPDSGSTGTDAGSPGSDAGSPGSDGGSADTTPASVAALAFFPTQLMVSSAAKSAQGLLGSTTVSYVVANAGGKALSGVTVSFAEQAGEHLVTFGATSAVSDANGLVSVAVTAKTQPGLANVDASVSRAVGTTTAIAVVGTPTITVQSSTPASLGIAGSGNNEFGHTTFLIADALGNPIPEVSVDFTQSAPALVTLGRASGWADASGLVTIDYTSGAVAGTGAITATITATGDAVSEPITVKGTKVVATPTIAFGSVTPDLLGLAGSGIQENGHMIFSVTDNLGNPLSSVQVTFSQSLPALVTLGQITGTSDANGLVSVDYAAGSLVGVGTITATLTATGASASHPIAVRGAKPSASGFYFRCNILNLPVYGTTTEHFTSTCTVRLADRFGNRVGIATPVSFFAEAGMISASVVTQPFDPADPTNPEEGSATVTFSSDLGNSATPADVAPLAAAPTQYPYPRLLAEPSATNGELVFNPRDQLVTIIAMVRGEEAFDDANLNGKYDAGELYVDQGDPYIDANDNNVWDSTENHFCDTADCSTYHGPNGVWDADKTIWVPTWVVFTGIPGATSSAGWQPSSCIDYLDNTFGPPPNASFASASFQIRDKWLNTAASGTTYTATIAALQTGLTLTSSGNFSEPDGWGANNPHWVRVSATDNTKACALANGDACVEILEFSDFDPGFRLNAGILTSNKLPLPAPATGHACGAGGPTTGTHVAPFTAYVSAAVPQVLASESSLSGTFGY